MVEVDSWAAQVEQAEGHGPGVEHSEYIKGDIKYVTEIKTNDEGKKIKTTSQYKIVRKRVPKPIAARRKWKKYGEAKEDGNSPNPANTLPAEVVEAVFVRNSAGEIIDLRPQEVPNLAKQAPKCKTCQAYDHFTMHCPYKELLADADPLEEPGATLPSEREVELQRKTQAGTYIPPHMKGGAAARMGSSPNDRRDDWTVRITNLPEETTDEDLKEILTAAIGDGGRGGRDGRGMFNRVFLARDKERQRCKGFAFVTFHNREDAEKAILVLGGHRYEHLILKVEWAKPNNN